MAEATKKIMLQKWNFDPRIFDLLILSGWKEDRKVSIKDDLIFLLENNFHPSKNVENILSSFSQIKLSYKFEKYINFDVRGAVFWYPSFSWKFKNLISSEICPFGHSDRNIFFVSENNLFILVDDGLNVFYSFTSLNEVLCFDIFNENSGKFNKIKIDDDLFPLK